MDCAEGSYGQLWDHLGTKALVDECLLKTRCIFITHIHGDHQLGVLKIMLERDRLLPPVDPTRNDSDKKLYIVTPTPMMAWME
jgi:ribonuclease BN (tRNA processing enzyme)